MPTVRSTAAGVKARHPIFTKDDYAIIAMVEKGLGISIMPELLLKGRHDDIVIKELVPPLKAPLSALPITETSRNSPATRKFADYTIDWVLAAVFCQRRKRRKARRKGC